MGIPIFKIRLSGDRLIFNTGTAILVRQSLYTETPPPPPIKKKQYGNLNFVQLEPKNGPGAQDEGFRCYKTLAEIMTRRSYYFICTLNNRILIILQG